MQPVSGLAAAAEAAIFTALVQNLFTAFLQLVVWGGLAGAFDRV